MQTSPLKISVQIVASEAMTKHITSLLIIASILTTKTFRICTELCTNHTTVIAMTAISHTILPVTSQPGELQKIIQTLLEAATPPAGGSLSSVVLCFL